MKHKGLIGLLLLLNLSIIARAQEAGPQMPSPGTIRVSVDRINVGVTVTDSRGHSVRGLRSRDFRVFDNGVEQPLTGFIPSDDPAQLVLLIESSAADFLLGKLGKSPFAGADNLLKNISAVDRVAIVTYSDRPRMVLDFTPDKIQARRVIEEINAKFLSLQAIEGFGMLDLDLSSSLASTIDWLASVRGTKIILLISSGIDTSSLASWQAVQEKLKTSDVHILALSIFGDFRTPRKHTKLSPDERYDRDFVKEGISQSDQLLRDISHASGGHAFMPKNAKEFDRAYAAIAQLVRGEYTLEFAPPQFDHRLHSIQVNVRRFGYHLDYRQAYLAPASMTN
jgi:VWFA-related protein